MDEGAGCTSDERQWRAGQRISDALTQEGARLAVAYAGSRDQVECVANEYLWSRETLGVRVSGRSVSFMSMLDHSMMKTVKKCVAAESIPAAHRQPVSAGNFPKL
jgi:hypothetical protein